MESKFGLRTKTSENHWQQCEIKNLKISKPLIICLSGNGTKTELEANGFCKLAESLLGDKSQEVDLLGVALKTNSNLKEVNFQVKMLSY